VKSDGGLRQLFRKHLPQCFYTTIESRLTQGGIPDLHAIAPSAVPFWVECKLTSGNMVKLRPMQIGWLHRYSRMGGRAYVAVRRKRRREDELWLVPGRLAGALARNGLAGRCGARCYGRGGPSRWQWRAALAQLTGR
jgi:Holliday junction resolvase hjc